MVETTSPTVMIAVLTGGDMRRELDQYLLALVASDRRYNLDIRHAYDQPVASTRCGIDARFLESRAEFLLMMDQDIIPERNPLDLVKLDLDIVGCPIPIFKQEGPPEKWIHLNIWLEQEDGTRACGFLRESGSKLVEVPAVGTGVILIARRVLEHPDMRIAFLDTWKEDGTRFRGEDLNFCLKAREAGFKVWAAMNYRQGHAKVVNLATMLDMLQYVQKQGSGPFVSPARALRDKRLIFVVSPGRCGTGYLAKALQQLPDIATFHEPEPSFVHHLQFAQTDSSVAYQFWLDEKLPYISRQAQPIYLETSHLFCQGFAEPLLAIGIVPDIIVLRRPHREVALSMWRRKTIPARTKVGSMYHVQPDDPTVLLSFAGYEGWTDYQLCYWYCLEVEERATRLIKLFGQRGARTYQTTLAEITTDDGMDALIRALELSGTPTSPGVINANSQAVGSMPGGNLNIQERIVREQLG